MITAALPRSTGALPTGSPRPLGFIKMVEVYPGRSAWFIYRCAQSSVVTEDRDPSMRTALLAAAFSRAYSAAIITAPGAFELAAEFAAGVWRPLLARFTWGVSGCPRRSHPACAVCSALSAAGAAAWNGFFAPKKLLRKASAPPRL
jgi:hypothetical protein